MFVNMRLLTLLCLLSKFVGEKSPTKGSATDKALVVLHSPYCQVSKHILALQSILKCVCVVFSFVFVVFYRGMWVGMCVWGFLEESFKTD